MTRDTVVCSQSLQSSAFRSRQRMLIWMGKLKYPDLGHNQRDLNAKYVCIVTLLEWFHIAHLDRLNCSPSPVMGPRPRLPRPQQTRSHFLAAGELLPLLDSRDLCYQLRLLNSSQKRHKLWGFRKQEFTFMFCYLEVQCLVVSKEETIHSFENTYTR